MTMAKTIGVANIVLLAVLLPVLRLQVHPSLSAADTELRAKQLERFARLCQEARLQTAAASLYFESCCMLDLALCMSAAFPCT